MNTLPSCCVTEHHQPMQDGGAADNHCSSRQTAWKLGMHLYSSISTFFVRCNTTSVTAGVHPLWFLVSLMGIER